MTQEQIIIAHNSRWLALQAVGKLRAEWESLVNPTVLEIPEDYNRGDLSDVCIYGDLPALQELFNQGLDIHLGSNNSALTMALVNGQMDIVHFLEDKGCALLEANDGRMSWAVEDGHIEAVRYYLDHGADLHIDSGKTLLKAVNEGHYDVVDLLIERGAPIEKLNDKQLQAYANYKQLLNHTENILTEAFTPKTWVGHAPEMRTLWSQVPKALRSKFDFSHALSDVTLQTMKQIQRKAKITLTR